jgi:hypothetical protein
MGRIDYKAIYESRKARRSDVHGPVAPRTGPRLSAKAQARLYYRGFVIAAFSVLFGVWQFLWFSPGKEGDDAELLESSRRLSDNCGLSAEELQDQRDVHASGIFILEAYATARPDKCPSGEGPCLKERYKGYLALYMFGMLYMFVALAIVCDEFFCTLTRMLHGRVRDFA